MTPHPLDPIIEALEQVHLTHGMCPSCMDEGGWHHESCEAVAALALARKWREEGRLVAFEVRGQGRRLVLEIPLDIRGVE